MCRCATAVDLGRNEQFHANRGVPARYTWAEPGKDDALCSRAVVSLDPGQLEMEMVLSYAGGGLQETAIYTSTKVCRGSVALSNKPHASVRPRAFERSILLYAR